MALDLTKSISANALAWSLALDALDAAQDTEDAALVALAARVTALEAVAAPTPTPVPSPGLAFDAATATTTEGNGGPRTVASTITLVRDGLTGDRVVNLAYAGSATGGGDYVAGPASVTVPAGQSTAALVLTITGDATVEPDETIVVTATLAGYGGVTATKTITVANDDAAPVFTRTPAITTDGTPTVDEVVALDFGAIQGDTIGTRQILRADDTIVATVTTGSYRLAAAGQIRLRVYAQNTGGLFADSPAITVAAPVTGAISAPVMYFDGARVAGTNPPEVLFDAPDGSNLATDILVGEVTSNGATAALEVQLSIAQLTAQDFAYASFANLAAGSFSMRTRFKRERDIDGNAVSPPQYSAWSGTLTDTLDARTLPPATTMWSTSDGPGKSKYTDALEMVAGGGDYRKAEGRGAGQISGILADQDRTDARYWEHRVYKRRNGPSGNPVVLLGACSPAAVAGPEIFTAPAGMVAAGYDWGDSNPAIGDRFLCYYKPATGGANGVLKVWKNGVPFSDQTHGQQGAWTIYNSYKNDDGMILNTGQEAIADTGLVAAIDPTAVRFN